MDAVKNVSCFVVVGLYVMLLVRPDGKLMTPGGKRDHKERKWTALMREWMEEVGMNLPRSGDVDFGKSFCRSHSNGTQTKIYVGYSSRPMEWFVFNKDGVLRPGETVGIRWMTVDDALRSDRVVGYVRDSLRDARRSRYL
jgi:8-oxo-dGTP pyrophosphatase MutT (NUDIX family)